MLSETVVMVEQKQAKVMKAGQQKSSTALVLGILGLAFGLFGFWPIGLILSFIGLIKALKKDEQESATVALVCSIVGLIISILGTLLLILIIFLILAAASASVYSF